MVGLGADGGRPRAAGDQSATGTRPACGRPTTSISSSGSAWRRRVVVVAAIAEARQGPLVRARDSLRRGVGGVSLRRGGALPRLDRRVATYIYPWVHGAAHRSRLVAQADLVLSARRAGRWSLLTWLSWRFVRRDLAPDVGGAGASGTTGRATRRRPRACCRATPRSLALGLRVRSSASWPSIW